MDRNDIFVKHCRYESTGRWTTHSSGNKQEPQQFEDETRSIEGRTHVVGACWAPKNQPIYSQTKKQKQKSATQGVYVWTDLDTRGDIIWLGLVNLEWLKHTPTTTHIIIYNKMTIPADKTSLAHMTKSCKISNHCSEMLWTDWKDFYVYHFDYSNPPQHHPTCFLPPT